MLGVFTSGTTSGGHRLILYSRENIITSLESIRSLYDTGKIQKIFSYPQPTHTFGLVLGYMHAIIYQLEICFFEGPYSKSAHQKWFAEVNERTLTLGTPTHFLDLIQWVLEQKKPPIPSYTAIVGGASASKILWQQMKDVLNIAAPSVGYGATEASPGVTHLPPGIPPRVDGDIGYALPGVKIQSKSGLGIEFSGPNVCLAILENGEFQARRSIILKDHLHVDSSETLPRYSFAGRTDSLVNRGGAKLSLDSIEMKVAAHFGARVLAVALYDERLGEDVAILINEAHPLENFLQEEFGLRLNPKNILVQEIPLNLNGKMDRKEALKLVLRAKGLKPPVAVGHLRAFLPHRAGAIWVDRLLETKKHFGICEVVVDPKKNYFSEDGFRSTACIEWVAQTYGYTAAMNEILQIQAEKPSPRAFIVDVKYCEIPLAGVQLKEGDVLKVEVHCTHDFGSLKVVDGSVFYSEKLLARMSLKLYCGQ